MMMYRVTGARDQGSPLKRQTTGAIVQHHNSLMRIIIKMPSPLSLMHEVPPPCVITV